MVLKNLFSPINLEEVNAFLSQSQKRFSQFESSLIKWQKSTKVFLTSLEASFSFLNSSLFSFQNQISQTMKNYNELERLSEYLKLDSQLLEKLKYSSDLAQVSFGDLVEGLKVFKENLRYSTSETSLFQTSLKELGLNLSSDELDISCFPLLLSQVSDKLKVVSDSASQASLLFPLFGNSYKEVYQVLSQGSQELSKQGEYFQRFGNSFSADSCKRFKEMSQILTQISTLLKGIFLQALLRVSPQLKELLISLRDFLEKNSDNLKEGLTDIFQNMIKALRILLPFITSLISHWRILQSVILAVIGLKMISLFKNFSSFLLKTFSSFSLKIFPVLIQQVRLVSRIVGQFSFFLLSTFRNLSLLIYAKLSQVFLAFLPILRMVIASAWQFSAALLANPITWVIASLVALVGVLFFLEKKFSIISFVISSLKKGLSEFSSWIVQTFDYSLNFLEKVAMRIKIAFSSAFSWIKEAILALWEITPLKQLINFFSDPSSYLKKLGQAFSHIYETFVPAPLKKVMSYFSSSNKVETPLKERPLNSSLKSSESVISYGSLLSQSSLVFVSYLKGETHLAQTNSQPTVIQHQHIDVKSENPQIIESLQKKNQFYQHYLR